MDAVTPGEPGGMARLYTTMETFTSKVQLTTTVFLCRMLILKILAHQVKRCSVLVRSWVDTIRRWGGLLPGASP